MGRCVSQFRITLFEAGHHPSGVGGRNLKSRVAARSSGTRGLPKGFPRDGLPAPSVSAHPSRGALCQSCQRADVQPAAPSVGQEDTRGTPHGHDAPTSSALPGQSREARPVWTHQEGMAPLPGFSGRVWWLCGRVQTMANVGTFFWLSLWGSTDDVPPNRP